MILSSICTARYGMPEVDMPAAKNRGELLGELRALVGRQQDDRRELAEVRTHELQLIDWQALHAMETLGG